MTSKRACDSCYTKKISCDQLEPDTPCDWCRHHQLACTFNRVRARKQGSRHGSAAAKFKGECILSSQLEPIDVLVERVVQGQTPDRQLPSSADIPLHEQSQRVKPPDFITLSGLSRPNNVLEGLNRETAQRILQVYAESSARLVFPLVDPLSFQHIIDVAFGDCQEADAPNQAIAQACLLAFVSVMCYFDEKSLSLHSSSSSGAKCASEAHKILFSMDLATSFPTLQAITMLHIHYSFSGHVSAAIQMHQSACRLVVELGGHTARPNQSGNASSAHDVRERQQLRMIFWQCYIFDKHITLRTGLSPLLPDNVCDLTPPDYSPDDACLFSDIKDRHLLSFPCSGVTPLLPGDLNLSHLKAKTWRLLYSPEARDKSSAVVLRTIRELDHDLETWRLSIPLESRPSFLIFDKSRIRRPEIDLPSSLRHHTITLHLEYHHLFILIHQASARCRYIEDSVSLEEAWKTGVQSSNALALDASRSTLLYLERVQDRLAGEAFWIVVHYPTVAMQTLFLNILADPSGVNTTSDRQLISSTAAVLKKMPILKISGQELSCISYMEKYIQEATINIEDSKV